MSVEEVRVASVDVAGFHSDQILNELVRRLHAFLEESDDHVMELLLEHGVSPEQLLVQKLTQNSNQFIIHQRDTLQAGFFQPLDLLLDDQFEGGSSNEKRRRGTRRVVENGSDIDILHMVEGIHGLDTVRVELVEHKADTSTTRQFNAGQLLVVSFQHCTVFIAELGDNVQNNICAIPKHGITQPCKLRRVFLKGRGDSGLDIRQGLLDVHHKDLDRLATPSAENARH